jgi:hypothetical protein
MKRLKRNEDLLKEIKEIKENQEAAYVSISSANTDGRTSNHKLGRLFSSSKSRARELAVSRNGAVVNPHKSHAHQVIKAKGDYDSCQF